MNSTVPGKKKIMILTSAVNVSGPVKGVFQLLENYNKNEIEAVLYDFQYTETPDTTLAIAVKERGFVFRQILKYQHSYFSLIQQVVREVRKNSFDIIQTHGFLPTFLGFFAKNICRIKWICFMHGKTYENNKVRLYNFIDNVLQLAADQTVLVSNAQRNSIFGGENTDRVKVLHNAVNQLSPMPMSSESTLESLGLTCDQYNVVLVAVGRFSPEKGLDVLLRAVHRLVAENYHVDLILVGDGQDRDILEKLVADLGLTALVHFIGYSQTPGDYVLRADILVLPSRSEGIPNVVLEAMALGTPVVATKVGGVPEIIEDNVNGCLVDADNEEMLAVAIQELIDNPERRSKLARAGKTRIQEKFSVENRVRTLEKLYDDLLEN